MKKFAKYFLCLLVCFLVLNFTACGNNIEFKLNFIVDSEVYSTITTSGNETISIPTNPTKEGYIFDGWYWDNGTWQKPFTANSLLNTPLSSDMNVYAKWETNDELKGTDANFKDFTKIDSETYSISVSNSTSSLNFSNVVLVASTSKWTLNTDIYALNSIPSKIATLEVGDNVYYILVIDKNENVK